MVTNAVIITIVMGVVETVALIVVVMKTEKRWRERFGILFLLAILAGVAIFLGLPYARKDLALSIGVYDIVFIFTISFYLTTYFFITTIEFAANATAAKKSAKDRKELIEKLEKEGRHDLLYNLYTAEFNEFKAKMEKATNNQ